MSESPTDLELMGLLISGLKGPPVQKKPIKGLGKGLQGHVKMC
jgi:hypothetical protein